MKWIQVFVGLLSLAIASAHAQPRGGSEVSFDSSSTSGHPIALRGVLFKPTIHPRGAIVLVHGSSGWTDHREGHYARAFSASGYAVLAIDSFGPRGIGGTVENQSLITSTQMTIDAFAARRYLYNNGFDPAKIALMGFSKGGQVALLAADKTFVPVERERFSLSIAFYPSCNNRPREPKPASLVFMALGEKDDYTGVKPCQLLAEDFARAGGSIQVKVYENSTHGFDGNPNQLAAIRLPTVENYMDCIVVIEPDGTQILDGKSFPSGDPAVIDLARKTCMRRGATVWTNLKQKMQATEDVISLLNMTFPK